MVEDDKESRRVVVIDSDLDFQYDSSSIHETNGPNFSLGLHSRLRSFTTLKVNLTCCSVTLDENNSVIVY